MILVNPKAQLNDLVDTWWKTSEIMNVSNEAPQELVSWHAYVFERILIQCGWNSEEWNKAVAPEKEIVS
jgi:hypothetical protein